MKVYIAGPLFSKEDQKKLEEIDKICKELNLDTYLPHRDKGVYQEGDSKTFFEADLKPLNECSFVIAILDWKGIGSGTAWEIGYAYSKGIPIIGLAEDLESLNKQERMCVMCYNSVRLVDSLEGLKKEIKSILRKE